MPDAMIPFSDPVIKRFKIRFKVDTPVPVEHVVRSHCGRLQHREYKGIDPEQHGSMETYYPVGTVLELCDFVDSGFAEIVTE